MQDRHHHHRQYQYQGTSDQVQHPTPQPFLTLAISARHPASKEPLMNPITTAAAPWNTSQDPTLLGWVQTLVSDWVLPVTWTVKTGGADLINFPESLRGTGSLGIETVARTFDKISATSENFDHHGIHGTPEIHETRGI